MNTLQRNLQLFLILITSFTLFFACKKEVQEPVAKKCIEGELFNEIPNLDFEDWYTDKGAGANPENYYNPGPKGFWATPNTGSGDIGLAKVPVVVFRVSGDEAYEGNAAKLVTGMGELLKKKTLTAATIAAGDFEIDINDPLNTLKFGKKFERRPKKVSGYYKYFPVEGDSASAYCFVTKFHPNGCTLDTLGFGRIIFYDEQSEYAKFEFELDYKSEETPDRLVIYFSSSEAGDKFEGQEGNTLYIDEVEVEYYD